MFLLFHIHTGKHWKHIVRKNPKQASKKIKQMFLNLLSKVMKNIIRKLNITKYKIKIVGFNPIPTVCVLNSL